MFISPLSLIDTQFITAPLAVDSAKKVTTTSIVLLLELTKTSIMSWVPALQSCKGHVCVHVHLTYGSVGQDKPSSISSSYADRVVVILFQLAEREDYNSIPVNVEGKVVVSASTGVSSVEVYYRHQITSTHESRLQGIKWLLVQNNVFFSDHYT